MASSLVRVGVRLYANSPTTMWGESSSDKLLATTYDYNHTDYKLWSDVKVEAGTYVDFGTMSGFTWNGAPSSYFGDTPGGWYTTDTTVTFRYYNINNTYTDKTAKLQARDHFKPNSYGGSSSNNYFTSYYIGTQYVPAPSSTGDSYVTKYVQGSDGYKLWCYSYYTYTENYVSGTTGPASYAGTRTGYTFNNGKGEVSPINGSYAANETISSTTTTTLYTFKPTWTANTYTIKYNGNGSTSGSVADTSATYDKDVTISTNSYKRTGYTFINWNTKADGSGTSYTPGDKKKNLTATNGGTVTLYAQWSALEYTIKYNANGGNASSVPADQPKTYGKDLTLSSTIPTKNKTTSAGFVLLDANGGSSTGDADNKRQFEISTPGKFVNWNTAANGSGTSYTKSATYKANANATLYAQGAEGTKYVSADATLPTAIKTGSIFKGWYTAKTGGTKVSDGAGAKYTPPVAGITLYAQWTEGTIVNFDANGGTLKHDSTIIIPRNSTTYYTLESPTSEGYYFDGWITRMGREAYVWASPTTCNGNTNLTDIGNGKKWIYDGNTQMNLTARGRKTNIRVYWTDNKWHEAIGYVYNGSSGIRLQNIDINSPGFKVYNGSTWKAGDY